MRIAVLRGGPSTYYDESLASGERVLAILRGQPERYDAQDIFISREGDWYRNGLAVSPEKVLGHTDKVFNALHGSHSGIQKLLQSHNIPYTGSDALASALTSEQHAVRERLGQSGLVVPKYILLDPEVTLSEIQEIFRTFVHPVAVIPARGDSAYGQRIVTSYHELMEAVAEAFRFASRVLVEECVRGKEVECGVIDNMRGEKFYALLPLPQSKSSEQNKIVENLARKIHKTLGLRHSSFSRFVLTPQGKVYITKVTAEPRLGPQSSFIEALDSVGITPREYVNHLVDLAKIG
jgi:D-alanine-D-alanine ligase